MNYTKTEWETLKRYARLPGEKVFGCLNRLCGDCKLGLKCSFSNNTLSLHPERNFHLISNCRREYKRVMIEKLKEILK